MLLCSQGATVLVSFFLNVVSYQKKEPTHSPFGTMPTHKSSEWPTKRQLLKSLTKGTTINDLGVGPEEIEKKIFLKVHVPKKKMYLEAFVRLSISA